MTSDKPAQEHHRHGISVVERRWIAVRTVDWDAFAQQCGGSIRSSHSHITAWLVKRRLKARSKVFMVYLVHEGGRRRQIGQCVVARMKQHTVFLDRLQLLPDCQHLWVDVMTAVVQELGPGSFQYGWELNTETSKSADIATITGVRLSVVRPLTVQAVEFSRWDSWEKYLAATSSNIRRNAKKAANTLPDLSVHTERGLRALRRVPALVRMRDDMYKRKGLRFGALSAAASSAGTILSCPKYAFVAVAATGDKVLAAFSGYSFGGDTYYTDGASASDNTGASWYLMLQMLEDAYRRDPAGKFVMGYVDRATHDDSVGGGLLRSRMSCRVTDFDTEIVQFEWTSAVLPPD